MLRFDEIGYWSELKLEIVRQYAAAYSTILSAQRRPALRYFYIDAFAGAGVHVRRSTGEWVLGSPLNALNVIPPFSEYWFIDLSQEKIDNLREAIGERTDVHLLQGDCNEILVSEVFPRLRYEDFTRGLCLIDPYGLDLDWDVIKTAGQLKTIEVFLNFPVMDMNRNVLWHDASRVDPIQRQRMTRYWGDESWRQVAYTTENDLFGFERRTDNETIATAFRDRLRDIAGFRHVPEPIPMRNSTGATVYYLFFASPKAVADKIVTQIFDKYRDYGRH
jgi:three-Cys-motif partner protein